MSCLILDMTEAELWEDMTIPAAAPKRIPSECRPTVLQKDRETAELELLRLAKRYPGRRFVLFEPRAQAVTIKVPTHATLGGKVVAERTETLLVTIQDPTDPNDDLPF